MHIDFLRAQTWRLDPNGVSDTPRGMLGREEGALLYHLARDGYEGLGEIIDAGAFLGSSSFCLAKGLSENGRILNKPGRLHSYDLFTVWHEQGQTDSFVAGELGRGFDVNVGGGESTLPIYMRNLGEFGSLIRVHVGDVLAKTWSGRPIEILFIDICKSKNIWKHVLRQFYTSLIPGRSIVVHQDYHHPLLPYLHVVQEWLSPYFEIVEPKAHDSAAFFLRERIPDRMLAQAAQYDFSAAQELRLMDRAIERLNGNNDHLFVAKAHLLGMHGRIEQARSVLRPIKERIERGENLDAMLPLYLGMAEAGLFRVEAERTPRPLDFTEAGYLGLHPDVLAAVDEGVFQSGFEHWLAFGCKEGRRLTPLKGEGDS